MPRILILVLSFVIIGLIVFWHSRKTIYKCPKCEKKFKISFFKDFISPHWPGRKGGYKYLGCPKCGKQVIAKEVK